MIELNLKGKNAIFCISGSPFQALCMIEAISAFEIKDYKVLLCLSESELPREKQLIMLLEKFGITYEIESVNFKITKQERIKALIPNFNKYKIAFIGDCNNELLIFKAFRYVSDGGTLIYLDDGIATIQFYNGLCHLKERLRKYYSLICLIRNINFDKYFFTIYHDLHDNKHVTIPNSFRYLMSQRKSIDNQEAIVFLGTCTDDFCRMEGINTQDFLLEQQKIFSEIKQKFPNDKIIFVPHGRDVYNEPKESCRELDIFYQRSDISVEMNILAESYIPKVVYGFTSSALYNLNRMLPNSEIVNITFRGNKPQNDRIEITSQYYSKHGIKRIYRTLQN